MYVTRAAIAEARVFDSWQDYQDALKRAIAPLTEEQLGRRLLPGLRTPGEIAVHIVFGRAKWVHHALGEEAAELVPLIRWDDEGGTVAAVGANGGPPTAAEIVAGLELTWRYIAAALMRGAPGDVLAEEDARFGSRSGACSTTTCRTRENCRCCWVRPACRGWRFSAARALCWLRYRFWPRPIPAPCRSPRCAAAQRPPPARRRPR